MSVLEKCSYLRGVGIREVSVLERYVLEIELCKLRQSKLRLWQGNFKEISYLKEEAGQSISV